MDHVDEETRRVYPYLFTGDQNPYQLELAADILNLRRSRHIVNVKGQQKDKEQREQNEREQREQNEREQREQNEREQREQNEKEEKEDEESVSNFLFRYFNISSDYVLSAVSKKQDEVIRYES